MPRYATPHWTDGDGIGQKLTGVALDKRLKRLADDANLHHRKVQGMLDHARLAGDALIEAKRRLGHRTKWSKWRRENFDGSKETACHYMRVARHWDDPRIRDAKAAGATIDSINKFMKFLRREPLESLDDATETSLKELEIEFARQELRRAFSISIRSLDPVELKTLGENFEERSWPKMYADLQQTVCGGREEDYYLEPKSDDSIQVVKGNAKRSWRRAMRNETCGRR